MYNATDLNEFDKHLLEILNQHGIDSMLSVVHDEIEKAYKYGYDVGAYDGWCDCYDTYAEEIDGYDYSWEHNYDESTGSVH